MITLDLNDVMWGLLQGESGKMSASDPNSAIYVSDNPKQIKDKVSSAFSAHICTVWNTAFLAFV